jgi:hypothetical protein
VVVVCGGCCMRMVFVYGCCMHVVVVCGCVHAYGSRVWLYMGCVWWLCLVVQCECKSCIVVVYCGCMLWLCMPVA